MLPSAVLFALLCRVAHDLWLPDAVPSDGDRALMLLALLALGHVVLFEIVALVRVLWQRASRDRGRALQRFRIATAWLEAALPAVGYAILIFVGNWPVFVRFELESSWYSVHEFLVVSPILLFLLLGLLSELRLGENPERAARRLRMGVFLLALFLGLHAWLDLVRWHPLARAAFDQVPWMHGFLLALGVCVGLLAMPWFLAGAMRLRRIDAVNLLGELRALAARMRVRPGRVRELETEGRLLNAFVVGPFAWTRHVVFTDVILRRFTLQQLVAVFAHELAHVRGQHFTRLIAFVVLLPLALFGAFAPEGLDESDTLLLFAGLFAAFLPVLVWLRRRFEHEADLLGAEALGDPQLVVEPLEYVALGGVGRNRGGLFHPSVAKRVRMLRAAQEDPAALRGWWRGGQRIQGALLLVLGIATGFFASRQVEHWELDRARFLLSAGRPESAAELWQAHLPAHPPESAPIDDRELTPARRTSSFRADAIEPGAWELLRSGHRLAPGGIWAEGGEPEPPAEDEAPSRLAPFEIPEAAPDPWERLGSQILRTRALLAAGDPRGSALVPILHRRALRRAARALEGGDREAGRLWIRLASRFEDLNERESALLLWLEAWRNADEDLQRRAAAILQRAGGSPGLDPVVFSLLRGSS